MTQCRTPVRSARLAPWAGSAAMLFVAGLALAADPPAGGERPAVPAADERRPGPGERRGFGPPRGLRGDGEPGESWPDLQGRMMEVLRDVNPAWATAVEDRMATDPEGTRRGLQQGARRLMALAVLKDRNPALYELKVAELRQQGEVREIAIAFHAAREAGDEARVAELAARLDEAARVSVELGLKARTEELAALERTVAEFRAELAADTEASGERAAEVVERMTRKAPSGHPFELLAPRGGRGEGEPRGGAPSKPPAPR